MSETRSRAERRLQVRAASGEDVWYPVATGESPQSAARTAQDDGHPARRARSLGNRVGTFVRLTARPVGQVIPFLEPAVRVRTRSFHVQFAHLDYRQPHGEHVGIAVIPARATKPAKQIGVVLGNPGTPGVSGVDFVLGGISVPAFARLRERFDIVSFDPRGVGRSRPVRCTADFPDPPPDLDSVDDETLATISIRWAACSRKRASIRTSPGSRSSAPTTSRVTSTWCAVRWASGRSRFVEFLSEYSTAFEQAFRRLDQHCRRDPACRLADTGVVVAFDEIAAHLKAGPVTSLNGSDARPAAVSLASPPCPVIPSKDGMTCRAVKVEGLVVLMRRARSALLRQYRDRVDVDRSGRGRHRDCRYE
jgi:hypothetical protein